MVGVASDDLEVGRDGLGLAQGDSRLGLAWAVGKARGFEAGLG